MSTLRIAEARITLQADPLTVDQDYLTMINRAYLSGDPFEITFGGIKAKGLLFNLETRQSILPRRLEIQLDLRTMEAL